MTCTKCKSENTVPWIEVLKGVLMRVCLDCGYAKEPGGWGFGIHLSKKELDYYKNMLGQVTLGVTQVASLSP